MCMLKKDHAMKVKVRGNLGYVVILNEKGKYDGEKNGQCKIGCSFLWDGRRWKFANHLHCSMEINISFLPIIMFKIENI